jgi:hypothetical protein
MAGPQNVGIPQTVIGGQAAQAKPPPIGGPQNVGIPQTVTATSTGGAKGPTPAPASTAPMAPAPVTADPRDSTYWIQHGKLVDQYQNAQARSSLLAGQDTANEQLAVSRLDAANPRNIYLDRVAANRQGVLGSGMEQQRVNDTETRFAQLRGAQTSGLAARLAALGQGNQNASTAFTSADDAALLAARTRGLNGLLKNPPATPTPTPPSRAVGSAIQKAAVKRLQTKKGKVF